MTVLQRGSEPRRRRFESSPWIHYHLEVTELSDGDVIFDQEAEPEAPEPEAPGRADHVASFETLGWTFYVRNDGGLTVLTSRFEPKVGDDGKTNAVLHMSPDMADMVQALIALADGPHDPPPSDEDASSVGANVGLAYFDQ